MTSQPTVSIFQSWSRAYFVNLLVGMLAIACLTILVIRHSTKEERIGHLETFAAEFAQRVIDENGHFVGDRAMDQISKDQLRQARWSGLVEFTTIDAQGNRLFPIVRLPSAPGSSSSVGLAVPGPSPIVPYVLQALQENPTPTAPLKKTRDLPGKGGTLHIVQVPVVYKGSILGSVGVAMTDRDAAQSQIPYTLLVAMLVCMLLLGWGTIYLLTKRLVRPIQQVADAANAMMAGQYDIRIDTGIKEKELYEMMHAIRKMADKIKSLESIRTLLLAGVTHDLKTPIASISGLVQAVKDHVVEDEEKEEFLTLTLQETRRLQRMVEDLLDYHSFATGALQAELEPVNLSKFVAETVHQWQMADEDHQKLQLSVHNDSCPSWVRGDPVRMQQILVNLLNNAFQALQEDGSIVLRLYACNEQFAGIDVIDDGRGIPAEEAPYIFERFYRGEGKKYRTRGLGLGLPFSLMLARAQGGELRLTRTSPEGTVFTLLLLKDDRQGERMD